MAHIPSFSRLFPSPPVHKTLAETGRRQSPGGVLGGISRAVGIWLGHFGDSPCPATTPTALGLALVLPTHDCPSSGKRQWAHDGVKQVENTFHSPRDFSTLSVTPFLGDHGAKGAGEHRAPSGLALVGRRVCKPFPGGCWVALLACGVSGSRAELRLHRGAQGSRRAAIPQAGNTPPSPIRQSHRLSSYDSICPYQLIRSANEPGVFNLPFISPR